MVDLKTNSRLWAKLPHCPLCLAQPDRQPDSLKIFFSLELTRFVFCVIKSKYMQSELL